MTSANTSAVLYQLSGFIWNQHNDHLPVGLLAQLKPLSLYFEWSKTTFPSFVVCFRPKAKWANENNSVLHNFFSLRGGSTKVFTNCNAVFLWVDVNYDCLNSYTLSGTHKICSCQWVLTLREYGTLQNAHIWLDCLNSRIPLGAHRKRISHVRLPSGLALYSACTDNAHVK